MGISLSPGTLRGGRAAIGTALLGVAMGGVALLGEGAAAQGRRPGPATRPGDGWVVVAPDAALAWFSLLADLRLPGAGAFAFTAGGDPRAVDRALTAALARTREGEILHFVPLYHPSADRAGLVAAVRAAGTDAAPGPASGGGGTAEASARATLLVGALRAAITPAARRTQLPALADALARAQPSIPSRETLRTWQRSLDSLYLPALAPWLALERLDAGRLIVAPAIGAEGRLFAGTADRADNLVAVGTFDGEPEAPLLAFAREVCFPAVTRAARAARLDAEDPGSARRASLAAVRCGAMLLDARLPARADAYRAFWLRRLASPPGGDALRARFETAFPPDPALAGAIDRDLRRLSPVP